MGLKQQYAEQFNFEYAIGDEGTVIQDKVEEYADEIFAKLDAGAHMYFCVSDADFVPIDSLLEGMVVNKGRDYGEFKARLGQRFRRVC